MGLKSRKIKARKLQHQRRETSAWAREGKSLPYTGSGFHRRQIHVKQGMKVMPYSSVVGHLLKVANFVKIS